MATAPAAEAANTQNTPSNKTEVIPWDQIGAKAGADYHGDGLSVEATDTGARLHCVFQRLDGEATGRGLWLEEYSVSLDGVRQDFVPEKRRGDGQLRVQLAVSGARVQPAAYGAQLARFAQYVEPQKVSRSAVGGHTVRFFSKGKSSGLVNRFAWLF